MKKLLLVPAALVAGLALAGTASAASRLAEFGTGEVSVDGGTVTITNDPGEYGGVHVHGRPLHKTALADVTVGFTVPAGQFMTGGAPRFSIPIDTDGDGAWDFFAFMAADRTAHAAGEDVWVSTTNPDSIVDTQHGFYANWEAFVAEHPSYRVAKDASAFVIADVAGTYTIKDIDLQ